MSEVYRCFCGKTCDNCATNAFQRYIEDRPDKNELAAPGSSEFHCTLKEQVLYDCQDR